MSRDEVIRMAHEAGWPYADGDRGYDPLWRFAELVAAAERAPLLTVLQEVYRAGVWPDMMPRVEAAIAKATGVQS